MQYLLLGQILGETFVNVNFGAQWFYKSERMDVLQVFPDSMKIDLKAIENGEDEFLGEDQDPQDLLIRVALKMLTSTKVRQKIQELAMICNRCLIILTKCTNWAHCHLLPTFPEATHPDSRLLQIFY